MTKIPGSHLRVDSGSQQGSQCRKRSLSSEPQGNEDLSCQARDSGSVAMGPPQQDSRSHFRIVSFGRCAKRGFEGGAREVETGSPAVQCSLQAPNLCHGDMADSEIMTVMHGTSPLGISKHFLRAFIEISFNTLPVK